MKEVSGSEKEKLLKDFKTIEESIDRAKLTFEIQHNSLKLYEVGVEITLYELIKSTKLMTDMVRRIDAERFGIRKSTCIHTPELSEHRLNICPYCGEPGCTGDHK